ncbi:MAG TPA: long-chain fatty acid--CoA ligase [Ktedonobacteraceae bacterium]|nr:long-chain fatty acid--CoA ligase [Ktedonobacteraceae bacterium]
MSDPSVIHNAPAGQQNLPDVGRPWTRHYARGVPAVIDIPDHPLTWLLDSTVSTYPSHTAFIYYGTKLSYAQFSSLANRFAMALQRLGIEPGDRVAIALPNMPQYPIAYYGALRAGAVVVPTNPLYTEREMQHQLADSGARAVVMLDMFYPVVRAVREKTALEHFILTSPADYLPPLLHRLYPLSQRNAKHPEPPLTEKELREDKSLHIMQNLLEAHTKGGIEVYNLPVAARGDDLAVLQYTGGTTGLSKGAMLTHRNLLANTLQTRMWVVDARDAQEISLCVAPFFHSYGMTACMNLSIAAAATMILLPQFKVKEVVTAIRRYHPTQLPGIPTMYLSIMKEMGSHSQELRSIKYCISGASALPAKVRIDWERLTGGKLVEGYGLSEAAPVTHCNPLNGDIREGSIGLPLPDIDSVILDEQTGKPLPVGEAGEIAVKGPNIMRGYWNQPGETADIFVHGWMRTGDIGKMDEDGYFYVVDRAKDMIKASGFNIFPREVEEVLFHHPAVQEAAVVGVPHEYRIETVAAVIVLKPGYEPSDATRQDILAFCKKELTPYKVPKIVEFRESLPKSLIGKVLKRELRETIKKPS